MTKTDRHFWDGLYLKSSRENGLLAKFAKQHELARFSSLYFRLNLLFKRHFVPGNKRVLELGCAPGRWLVYFNQKFGYDVYGIDYSKVGCELTEKTLSRYGVKGKIICSDIFDSSFQSKYEGYFDVVYSLGLIEHFEDPSQVLSIHSRLLKEGGILLITMPNYADGTLYRRCIRGTVMEKDLLSTHNVDLMKIANFKKYVESLADIEIRTLSYTGPIILPFGGKHKLIYHLINQTIGYFTLFLNSQVFSSIIVLIGRKR